jgi:hypothetical protein
MTGGVVHLLAYGAQNYYVNGNPKITYFKRVFRTHTHFSTEPYSLSFANNTHLTLSTSSTWTCKIKRYGDLLGMSFLVMEFPPLLEGYRWVPNVAEVMIENTHALIGGSIIEQRNGQFIHLWRSMTMASNTRNTYETMINTSNERTDGVLRAWLPLPFWFCRDPGLAVPLVALQHHEMELSFVMRPLRDLVQVYDEASSCWKRIGSSLTPHDFVQTNTLSSEGTHTNTIGAEGIDMRSRIDAMFMFLDDKERKEFATSPVEYLIEQVTEQEFSTSGKHTTVPLTMSNLIKEVFWAMTSENSQLSNSWTLWEDVVCSAKLIVQGVDRLEKKKGEYYSIIQPYMHHTNMPPPGVYMYSFSLYPERFQPSGTLNASRMNKFQLYIETCDSRPYKGTFWAVNLNILRIRGGMGGLAFA